MYIFHLHIYDIWTANVIKCRDEESLDILIPLYNEQGTKGNDSALTR